MKKVGTLKVTNRWKTDGEMETDKPKLIVPSVFAGRGLI